MDSSNLLLFFSSRWGVGGIYLFKPLVVDLITTSHRYSFLVICKRRVVCIIKDIEIRNKLNKVAEIQWRMKYTYSNKENTVPNSI